LNEDQLKARFKLFKAANDAGNSNEATELIHLLAPQNEEIPLDQQNQIASPEAAVLAGHDPLGLVEVIKDERLRPLLLKPKNCKAFAEDVEAIAAAKAAGGPDAVEDEGLWNLTKLLGLVSVGGGRSCADVYMDVREREPVKTLFEAQGAVGKCRQWAEARQDQLVAGVFTALAAGESGLARAEEILVLGPDAICDGAGVELALTQHSNLPDECGDQLREFFGVVPELSGRAEQTINELTRGFRGNPSDMGDLNHFIALLTDVARATPVGERRAEVERLYALPHLRGHLEDYNVAAQNVLRGNAGQPNALRFAVTVLSSNTLATHLDEFSNCPLTEDEYSDRVNERLEDAFRPENGGDVTAALTEMRRSPQVADSFTAEQKARLVDRASPGFVQEFVNRYRDGDAEQRTVLDGFDLARLNGLHGNDRAPGIFSEIMRCVREHELDRARSIYGACDGDRTARMAYLLANHRPEFDRYLERLAAGDEQGAAVISSIAPRNRDMPAADQLDVTRLTALVDNGEARQFINRANVSEWTTLAQKHPELFDVMVGALEGVPPNDGKPRAKTAALCLKGANLGATNMSMLAMFIAEGELDENNTARFTVDGNPGEKPLFAHVDDLMKPGKADALYAVLNELGLHSPAVRVKNYLDTYFTGAEGAEEALAAYRRVEADAALTPDETEALADFLDGGDIADENQVGFFIFLANPENQRLSLIRQPDGQERLRGAYSEYLESLKTDEDLLLERAEAWVGGMPHDDGSGRHDVTFEDGNARYVPHEELVNAAINIPIYIGDPGQADSFMDWVDENVGELHRAGFFTSLCENPDENLVPPDDGDWGARLKPLHAEYMKPYTDWTGKARELVTGQVFGGTAAAALSAFDAATQGDSPALGTLTEESVAGMRQLMDCMRFVPPQERRRFFTRVVGDQTLWSLFEDEQRSTTLLAGLNDIQARGASEGPTQALPLVYRYLNHVLDQPGQINTLCDRDRIFRAFTLTRSLGQIGRHLRDLRETPPEPDLSRILFSPASEFRALTSQETSERATSVVQSVSRLMGVNRGLAVSYLRGAITRPGLLVPAAGDSIEDTLTTLSDLQPQLSGALPESELFTLPFFRTPNSEKPGRLRLMLSHKNRLVTVEGGGQREEAAAATAGGPQEGAASGERGVIDYWDTQDLVHLGWGDHFLYKPWEAESDSLTVEGLTERVGLPARMQRPSFSAIRPGAYRQLRRHLTYFEDQVLVAVTTLLADELSDEKLSAAPTVTREAIRGACLTHPVLDARYGGRADLFDRDFGELRRRGVIVQDAETVTLHRSFWQKNFAGGQLELGEGEFDPRLKASSVIELLGPRLGGNPQYAAVASMIASSPTELTGKVAILDACRGLTGEGEPFEEFDGNFISLTRRVNSILTNLTEHEVLANCRGSYGIHPTRFEEGEEPGWFGQYPEVSDPKLVLERCCVILPTRKPADDAASATRAAEARALLPHQGWAEGVTDEKSTMLERRAICTVTGTAHSAEDFEAGVSLDANQTRQVEQSTALLKLLSHMKSYRDYGGKLEFVKHAVAVERAKLLASELSKNKIPAEADGAAVSIKAGVELDADGEAPRALWQVIDRTNVSWEAIASASNDKQPIDLSQHVGDVEGALGKLKSIGVVAQPDVGLYCINSDPSVRLIKKPADTESLRAKGSRPSIVRGNRNVDVSAINSKIDSAFGSRADGASQSPKHVRERMKDVARLLSTCFLEVDGARWMDAACFAKLVAHELPEGQRELPTTYGSVSSILGDHTMGVTSTVEAVRTQPTEVLVTDADVRFLRLRGQTVQDVRDELERADAEAEATPGVLDYGAAVAGLRASGFRVKTEDAGEGRRRVYLTSDTEGKLAKPVRVGDDVLAVYAEGDLGEVVVRRQTSQGAVRKLKAEVDDGRSGVFVTLNTG